jgi:RNA polymerase sigma-70 factor (ECF subfamily)
MSTDAILIEQVRGGRAEAWAELIARFEGRLLAYVEARLRRRDQAEDVVQETFIGFLSSLPNYDPARPLESYLFSIAAHKLTDQLRRKQRRPELPLADGGSSSGQFDPPARERTASKVLQSAERRAVEATALTAALAELIQRWRERGQWQKIQCAELLLVAGWPNKRVAEALGCSEQTVANQKFELLERLRGALVRQRLSADLFPELSQSA